MLVSKRKQQIDATIDHGLEVILAEVLQLVGTDPTGIHEPNLPIFNQLRQQIYELHVACEVTLADAIGTLDQYDSLHGKVPWVEDSSGQE